MNYSTQLFFCKYQSKPHAIGGFMIFANKRNKLFSTLTIGFALFSSIQVYATHSFQKHDPVKVYRQRQANATPLSVVKWLKEGNKRFTQGKAIHGGYIKDISERRWVAAKSQRPLAVVLSCIDSRTTPEVVFDTTIGDLFTARVGANVINKDILGSIEISVASGAKAIVILGHTDCGGVKGACRGIEFGHMTQLLERVKPAITDTNDLLNKNPELSQLVGERVVENPKYIAQISHTNAQRSAKQVYEQSPILKEKIDSGEVVLVAAIYDVNSGIVTFDKIKK